MYNIHNTLIFWIQGSIYANLSSVDPNATLNPPQMQGINKEYCHNVNRCYFLLMWFLKAKYNQICIIYFRSSLSKHKIWAYPPQKERIRT